MHKHTQATQRLGLLTAWGLAKGRPLSIKRTGAHPIPWIGAHPSKIIVRLSLYRNCADRNLSRRLIAIPYDKRKIYEDTRTPRTTALRSDWGER